MEFEMAGTDESRMSAESRGMSDRDFSDLAKCAAASADAMSPLIGALVGGGIGLAADAIRPADEDEDRLKRRVTALLAGAALGGMAGHGLKRFSEVSPLVDDMSPPPPPPKKGFNPSWNTAVGTTLAALPPAILAGFKLRGLWKSNPALAKAIVKRTIQTAGAASMAAGGTMVARNQFRNDKDNGGEGGLGKRAFFYSAPKGTDRSDTRYGLSKETRDRIYANTRDDMFREAYRAGKGSGGLTWQGWRDPVTGKLLFPVSWGSRRHNVANTSMTPSQANMVSLLTKNRKIRDYRQLTRAIRNGRGGLDFMKDPSVVNLHSGKLTRHGMDDLKFAFKHVYGRDPTELDMMRLNNRMERLLGTHAGANGNPYRFEKYLSHTF